jgi:phosphatidylserine/phosphatidylglycerophosphate/cardiolipin synthase-like enzyme
MAVLSWQFGIIASISLVFWVLFLASTLLPRVRRSHAFTLSLATAAAWSIWTIAIVRSPQLRTWQLGVIAVALIVNWVVGSSLWRNKRLRGVNQQLEADNRGLTVRVKALASEMDEQERRALLAVPRAELTPLMGKGEHEKMLFDVLEHATDTVCITSGWINDRVVNGRFLAALKAALRRGVQVFIVFGYQSKQAQRDPMPPDAARALSALMSLRDGAEEWSSGRLLIAYHSNHTKYLVQDADLAVVTSHNWLSNKSFANDEGGVAVRDAAFAEELRRRILAVVKEANAKAVDEMVEQAYAARA